ncbi:VOC family protein [Plantactinospora siamensis]|uniref:VOC family protein n=1 Tax=Plantactinospora siamensis TaxID=555372 RepID=A0ABV6P052_9ACTN
MQQRITPYLWFDGQAEEAADRYVAIFRNSRILHVQRYGEHGPGTPGTAMVVEFELDGLRFAALNGGPQYHFTEATSFHVPCETQDEVDELWEKLTADGGEPGQCGWLKDRYGVSWQIVPTELPKLLGGPDPDASGRALQAMFKMRKLDIQALRDAYDGKP